MEHVRHTSRGVVMPGGADSPGFVDVGRKTEAGPALAKSSGKYYPSLRLDAHIPGLDQARIGADAVIIAKVRLTGVHKDKHGESMELEVREVKDINPRKKRKRKP